MTRFPHLNFKHGFAFGWWPTASIGFSFVYNRHVNGRGWVIGTGRSTYHFFGSYDQPIRRIYTA